MEKIIWQKIIEKKLHHIKIRLYGEETNKINNMKKK